MPSCSPRRSASVVTDMAGELVDDDEDEEDGEGGVYLAGVAAALVGGALAAVIAQLGGVDRVNRVIKLVDVGRLIEEIRVGGRVVSSDQRFFCF